MEHPRGMYVSVCMYVCNRECLLARARNRNRRESEGGTDRIFIALLCSIHGAFFCFLFLFLPLLMQAIHNLSGSSAHPWSWKLPGWIIHNLFAFVHCPSNSLHSVSSRTLFLYLQETKIPFHSQHCSNFLGENRTRSDDHYYYFVSEHFLFLCSGRNLFIRCFAFSYRLVMVVSFNSFIFYILLLYSCCIDWYVITP